MSRDESSGLITQAMVEKAADAYFETMNVPGGRGLWSGIEAALEAVVGDIIEAFGASGVVTGTNSLTIHGGEG